MLKIYLSGIAALILTVNLTGAAMCEDREKLKVAMIEDCQRRIKRAFGPPSRIGHNTAKYRADNKTVIRFKLGKTVDLSAKDVELVESTGDPDFKRAAESAVRNASYRPNPLAEDPLQLECTFTENEVKLKLLYPPK